MNCPDCNEPHAYVGFSSVECRNRACKNYSWDLAKTCACCGVQQERCEKAEKPEPKPAAEETPSSYTVGGDFSDCLASLEQRYGESVKYAVQWDGKGKATAEYWFLKHRPRIRAVLTGDFGSTRIDSISLQAFPEDIPADFYNPPYGG